MGYEFMDNESRTESSFGRLSRNKLVTPLISNMLAMVRPLVLSFLQTVDRTGYVFRVSPNELSFASVDSWKSIYGHQIGGRPTPVKGEFYDIYGSAYRTGCIGSERNPLKHSRMKRNLTAAFSTRALTEQEDIISRCVDTFLDKIGSIRDARDNGLNIVKWFEMVAFDILGEMTFGESFHAVESGLLLCDVACIQGLTKL